MKKNQHVVTYQDDWVVKGAGNNRATKVTSTQEQSIKVATGIVMNQHAEVVIHGRDGRICDMDSYGNDPKTIKDTKH